VKENDIKLLKHIAEVEDSIDPQSLPGKLGWTWREVQLWPVQISRLCIAGLVEDVYTSNSYHGYRLSEKARAMLAGEPTSGSTDRVSTDTKVILPDDLFEDIIGHEEVKELLKASLLADKPVHVLLSGPPALAKTLFLWDIERACGERAIWLVGSATSKAGLWDLVAERQPRVVLIDEVDKMSAADTAALLSMMEGGRLVRAKKGRELDVQHQIWVVAATNRTYGLSPELLSRFAVRKMEPYGREDYLAVVKGVLVRREDVDHELAEEIARRLDGLSQDVRDAIRVARLAPQLGIEKSIKLLLGGVR